MTGERDEYLASFGAQHRAARVLERRHRIEVSGSQARAQPIGEHIDPQAVAIHRYADQLRAGRDQHLARAEVARVVDHHRVAGVGEHRREQVHGLLRSGGDHEVVGGRARHALHRWRRRQHRAQLDEAVGGSVLQRALGAAGREEDRPRTAASSRAVGNDSGSGRPPASDRTPGASPTVSSSRVIDASKCSARRARVIAMGIFRHAGRGATRAQRTWERHHQAGPRRDALQWRP